MRRTISLLAALTFLVACAGTQKDRDAGSTASTFRTGSLRYLPDENLFPVGAIPNATLHDSQRNKDLELAIEYPTRGGPYPVIIFSHGWGATKESYTALTEYWTGHGFVCVKPSHADAGALRAILAKRREERRARLEKMREERKAGGKQPPAKAAEQAPPEPAGESLWSALTPSDWTNRVRDVTLIIDSLGVLEEKYPELAGKIRKDQIGLAGHSLGAFTGMLVGGTVDFKTTPPMRPGDPRVRAVLAMSPQGIGADQGLTTESWREMKIPIMFMTGSLDRGLGGDGDPKWRRDAFANSPAGDKFFISFKGARHSTFAGGVGDIDDLEIMSMARRNQGTLTDPTDTQGRQSRPRVEGDGAFMSERRIFGQIKTISTAFFDTYLKNDEAGRDYMKVGGILDMMAGPDTVVERK